MSSLSSFFARRYLFSKKSRSVINIISGVSAFAVAVPVAAMVVLLSVFNGFEKLNIEMSDSFDPDIMITPSKGKVFDIGDTPYERLKSIEGISEVSYILEENALFEYRNRQFIGIVRGVDSLYKEVVPIDSLITEGEYRLRFGELPEAVVGQGLAYSLGLRMNLSDPVTIFTPRRGRVNPLLPYSFYREERLFPAGVFALEAETDGKYMIVPLDFAQRFLDYEGRASGIVVKLNAGAQPEKTRQLITGELGDGFKVLTRYQQKEDFYRIMMYEKWGIYFIILLVLVVASFSLIGSLAMLIIDKRGDMRTLIRMGADVPLVRRIFVKEGMLIYCLGAGIGLALGIGVALLQQTFGLIRIAAETFLIDAYPVELKLTDILWIIVTFVALGFVVSRLTAVSMIPRKEIITE